MSGTLHPETLRLECLKLAVTRAAMIGCRNASKLAQSYFDYVTTGAVPADQQGIEHWGPPTAFGTCNQGVDNGRAVKLSDLSTADRQKLGLTA